MSDDLIFKSAVEYERGTAFSILSQSYAEIWSDKLAEKWGNFEREVFEQPDTVGACTWITSVDGEIAGLASLDPRKGPAMGIIGHNCVLPKFRGRGLGKAQVAWVLSRFKSHGFQKACVWTGDCEFFVPARRMYVACGMHETNRDPEPTEFGWSVICYEIDF